MTKRSERPCVQAQFALRKLLNLSKSPGSPSLTLDRAVVGSERIQFPSRDQLTMRFVIIAVVFKIDLESISSVLATKPPLNVDSDLSDVVFVQFEAAKGHELNPKPQHCK